jgi:hypothetical protein
MAKLPFQQVTTPAEDSDVATKAYADTLLNANPAAAQGALLECTNSSAQSGITGGSPGTVIAFNTVKSQGDLIFDDGTDEFRGLKAGRTYLCIGSWRITAGTYLENRWYNETDASWLGEGALTTLSGNEHATAMAVVTPTVDTVVTLRAQSTGSAATIDAAGGAYGLVIEIGAAVVNAVSGLEFMDVIEVTSDQTTVTFGASGDGVFQRALDGNVDEVYEIIGSWKPPSVASQAIHIRPNGISTGQESTWNYHNGSANSSNQEAGLVLQRTAFANDTEGFVRTIFDAATGKARQLSGTESIHGNGSGQNAGRTITGVWTDTSTNITSLDLVCATASGIKTGSKFWLYRRVRTPIRADSADTYERRVESAVAVGSVTTEQTTGHTAFGGSVVGLTARIEDAVTAGSVTVNLKVDGVTTLSTVLDTTNTVSNRAVAAIGVHTFGADKNVSVEVVGASYDNAGSVTSGITVVATLVNEALIQPPSAALVAALQSNLWYPPSTPHSDNLEFDSSALPAGWAETFTPSGAINAYDNTFTSGVPRRSIHTDRLSWYMVQVPGDGTGGYALYLDKGSLPTNFLMMARCRVNINALTAVNNDSTIGIFMCEDGGGAAPGFTSGFIDNGMSMCLNEQDGGTVQSEFFRYVTTTFTSGGASTDVDRQGQALSYTALHKIGNDYHGWVGTEAGNWIHLGSLTQAFTMRHVGIFFLNQNAAVPGPSIAGADFIRFYETDNFLL